MLVNKEAYNSLIAKQHKQRHEGQRASSRDIYFKLMEKNIEGWWAFIWAIGPFLWHGFPLHSLHYNNEQQGGVKCGGSDKWIYKIVCISINVCSAAWKEAQALKVREGRTITAPWLGKRRLIEAERTSLRLVLHAKCVNVRPAGRG